MVAKLILLVHSDLQFNNILGSALSSCGYELSSFTGSMPAIDALEGDRWPDLLITRTRFPDGQPPGPALARMALMKCPGIKVQITGLKEFAEYAEGIGDFYPHPVDVARLIDDAGRLLTAIDLIDGAPTSSARGTLLGSDTSGVSLVQTWLAKFGIAQVPTHADHAAARG
jgi:hypothetical protein